MSVNLHHCLRLRRWLALALCALVITVACAAAPSAAPVSQPGDQPAEFTVAAVDLHDGMLAKWGGTYYLYGTMYGCGFQWGITPTTFCGFGVSTAPGLGGPWTAPVKLFSQWTGIDPFSGRSWASVCAEYGAGCFNPRMLRRDDGVFVLWFTSPSVYTHYGANAYNVMGCNGPAGPCGAEAGPPHGTSHKPALWLCGGNGDMGFHQDGAAVWMTCTAANQTLSIEKLDVWWANGTNTGGHNLAGLAQAESPGVYHDPNGKWVLTYNYPNCGYCTGTGTGYALADSPAGPWTVPADIGFGPGVGGRRIISAASCGGQPRTISTVDGVAYQGVDLWTGARNQTTADQHFVPLSMGVGYGQAGDGGLFGQPFAEWAC